MFPLESNIVIADDSKAIVILLRQELKALGYKNIWDAENGKETLQRLSEIESQGKSVDILIVDWRMPEMDGLELVQYLRAKKKYETVPILMIAGEKEVAQVIKALTSGVTDYILKPFDEQSLSQKLESLYNKGMKS